MNCRPRSWGASSVLSPAATLARRERREAVARRTGRTLAHPHGDYRVQFYIKPGRPASKDAPAEPDIVVVEKIGHRDGFYDE